LTHKKEDEKERNTKIKRRWDRKENKVKKEDEKERKTKIKRRWERNENKDK
jgi:hypothetical protein